MENFNPGLTMEEFVDMVQMELTIGCSLPQELPNSEIQRYAETIAAKWFYRNYQYAATKVYYFLDKDAFNTEEYTRYQYITLPCEILTVNYIYMVNGYSRIQMGFAPPNMAVSGGLTSQPYLASHATTIGDLSVYKSVLNSFSDMLNQFAKFTTKYHYNENNNRLNILTRSNKDLILDVYAKIPLQNLLADDLFLKYVTGWAKIQQGNLLGRYDFTYAGGVKYNYDSLISQGKEEMQEVKDEILGHTNTGFFMMVKR